MDPQNQQPIQPPDTQTPPLIDNPSPDIITPESPQLDEPKHKMSKTKKIIIIVLVFVIACFALYWFAVPQNIIYYLEYGNKGNADILSIVKKANPNVVSVEVTRNIAQENERCLIDMPYLIQLGCNWFEHSFYEYRGKAIVKGAKFTIPFNFTLPLDKTGPQKVPNYVGVDNSRYQNIVAMTPAQWDSFVVFFNKLGYKSLLDISRPFWNGEPVVKPSTAIAGYEYRGLHIVCGSDMDNFYYIQQAHYECEEAVSQTPVHNSKKNGVFLVYYNEKKNEWSILSDDANYFVGWVSEQLYAFRSQTLSGVDWKKSPIKSLGK